MRAFSLILGENHGGRSGQGGDASGDDGDASIALLINNTNTLTIDDNSIGSNQGGDDGQRGKGELAGEIGFAMRSMEST